MGKRERAREGMMYREGWLWFGELRTARQERLMGWRYSVGVTAGGYCSKENKDRVKAGVGCRS